MTAVISSAVAAAAGKPAGAFETWEWSLLVVPVLGLLGAIIYLVVTGEDEGRHNLVLTPFYRSAASLRRVTGIPAWSIGGIGLALWSILVAGIGFYWDVAWHADLGRDKDLFTPPHLMILVGLMGFGAAALVSIIFANIEKAETGFTIFGIRVPYAALPMGIISIGATIGFPLDDLWHRTYGIDVTMWSPTHLIMIGGATMTPIASRLMLAEAGPDAMKTRAGKILKRSLNGSMLVALSAFQLEFDVGVPQWPALYQPIIIALATGIALVAARVALGRFGALIVAVNFLVIRGIFALLVGPVLGQVLPHMPLYLGIALSIEVAWYIGERLRLNPVGKALLCGAGIGTVGLATEYGFSKVWSYHPWHTSLFPGIWAAVAMALLAALVGLAMGSVLTYRKSPLRWQWLLVIGLLMAGLLYVPYQRHTIPMTATIHATPAGDPTAAIDRDGLPAVLQDYNVSLDVSPADAPVGSDWFNLISWQGGTTHSTELVSDGNGHYHSAAPVPTGGTWKTIVFMARRDVMMATPISMPADTAFGQAGTKVTDVDGKTVSMQPSQVILLAENQAASQTVKVIGYTFFFLMFGSVIILLGFAYTRVNRRMDMPYGGGPWPEPPDEVRKPKPALKPAQESA
ncbi:MAG: hypothetical protein WBD38_03635 [Candidatus Dormiibacterota bacterium]